MYVCVSVRVYENAEAMQLNLLHALPSHAMSAWMSVLVCVIYALHEVLRFCMFSVNKNKRIHLHKFSLALKPIYSLIEKQ